MEQLKTLLKNIKKENLKRLNLTALRDIIGAEKTNQR